MVTIIKNQLLKHLSRYLKNLSPEQISLSALRGSGELHDLALEEALLTELLELPGWLRITAAVCNRAVFRIQWTKLKTTPIVLSLDEVRVSLEVCSEPRVPSAGGGAALPAAGKYSYIHKVIDGISVSVNNVQVDFECDAFSSTVQISRVTVESRTPQWQKGDLRLTRVKSPDTGYLLIFKEVEWQTARVEARARGAAAAALPPLRLLAGAAHTRIVIKKRLADCSVVGCRLVVRPEPLAWALTDGQLRAACTCAAALAGPVRRATAAATRAKALRKIQTAAEEMMSGGGVAAGGGGERDALARLFARHDVRETSYHLLAPRIDLHLCDDPGPGRSQKPSLAGGGALQVTLVSMQADFFPYHRATDERRHWRGYRETATPHSQWLSQSLNTFCASLLETCAPAPAPAPPPHPADTQSAGEGGAEGRTERLSNGSATPHSPRLSTHDHQASSLRSRLLTQLGELMTTCLVLRIDDFTVYRVSTGAGREPARALVAAEKATLPGDAGLFHAELTHFYYPGDVSFPLPPPKLYAQVSPVRVLADPDSALWLASFLPHVARAAAASGPAAYVDVKLEAIMPKVVVEAGAEHVSAQRDRPRELHVCAARVSLSNVREARGAGSRADLAAALDALRHTAPPPARFPAAPDDLHPAHPALDRHAHHADDVARDAGLHGALLWRESRGVWCARAEPLWADLHGARALQRPVPLLDAVPATAWACVDDATGGLYCVASLGGLASVQLNHYQLLFLLRQLERATDTLAWMAHDARRLGAPAAPLVAGVLLPAAEVTLVLPAGGARGSRDLDSGALDTSSLADLRINNLGGSETTVTGGEPPAEPPPAHPTPAAPSPAPASPPPPPLALSGSALGTSFSGFSSMRRGLSSLVTSLDGALSRDDARSDAASTASSDSEHYVVVGLEDSPDDADLAFREFEQGRSGGGCGVEVAAEVLETSSTASGHSRGSARSAASGARRDLVGTAAWRLTALHVVHQSVGDRSRLRFAAREVRLEECAAIPWDELQSKFATRARAYSGDEGGSGAGAAEKGRAEAQLSGRLTRDTLAEAPGAQMPAGSAEVLEARVCGVRLSLDSGTALALAEFLEDEASGPSLPLEVELEDVEITLTESGARCIGSPPPRPLPVRLSRLRVARDAGGALTVGPPAPPAVSPVPADPPALAEHALRAENEELRRRLTRLSALADQNSDLLARAAEAATLRECVVAAQQETAALLADKRALLDRVLRLQEQLSARCAGRGAR